MKRILLASVAALGLAGTASAADLAVRAAPVPVPLFTWTGCYLGINGGWIGQDTSYTTGRQIIRNDNTFGDPNFATPAQNALLSHSYSSSQSGGTIGGQFGCQYQWGWFVLGGEWDANWAGVKDDNFFSYTAAATNNVWPPRQEWTHTQLDWFTTARVRVGAAWWDRVLVYATGGLAMASVDSYTQVGFNNNGDNPFFLPQYFGAYRESRIGWTVGGGIEWAFAANWTAKAEFLYIDLGSDDYVSPRFSYGSLINGVGDGRVWASSVDTQAYVARVGINYLFHLGPAVAPVVARY